MKIIPQWRKGQTKHDMLIMWNIFPNFDKTEKGVKAKIIQFPCSVCQRIVPFLTSEINIFSCIYVFKSKTEISREIIMRKK